MAWCNSGSRNMNSYAKTGYDRIGSFKALNFDHGLIISNPDDSSRSFSARFAVPSRIFEKDGLV
ncbi:hypothetical protein NC652_008349 [Populus alba x Populus x berolinensis]|nr:hypothetical protein NC652_008349 [Populus alba x Populus x berolinensis]